MSVDVRINGLHWPVTTLGYGNRIGIWFQGCSIGCPGCCARDTWERLPERATSVAAILQWIESHSAEQIDGVTISGGEPFEQPLALHALVLALRSWFTERDDADILIYSGLPWRHIIRQYEDIVALADVVISEPYVERLNPTKLRGSSNQRIWRLSSLAQTRYRLDDDGDPAGLQLALQDNRVTLIGIPRRGDLARIERELESRGITFQSGSWSGDNDGRVSAVGRNGR